MLIKDVINEKNRIYQWCVGLEFVLREKGKVTFPRRDMRA